MVRGILAIRLLYY